MHKCIGYSWTHGSQDRYSHSVKPTSTRIRPIHSSICDRNLLSQKPRMSGVSEDDTGPQRQSVRGLKDAHLVSTSRIRDGTQSEEADREKHVRESVAMLADSKIVSRTKGAETDADEASGLGLGSTLEDLRAAIAEADEQEPNSGASNTPVVTPGLPVVTPPSTPQAGVGLRFRPSSQGIRILNIAEGGPAYKSGKLKEGDVVVSVAGKIVKGMELDQIIQLLAGPHGSVCKMVKLKEGGEPEHIELIRETYVPGGAKS